MQSVKANFFAIHLLMLACAPQPPKVGLEGSQPKAQPKNQPSAAPSESANVEAYTQDYTYSEDEPADAPVPDKGTQETNSKISNPTTDPKPLHVDPSSTVPAKSKVTKIQDSAPKDPSRFAQDGFKLIDTIQWAEDENPYDTLDDHGMGAEDSHHDDCEDCHLKVGDDPYFGKALAITMDRDTAGDGSGGRSDRQRIEIKVTTGSPEKQANHNEVWGYSWWFELGSNITNKNGNFFHIFQIKSTGDNIDGSPQFILSVRDGYLERHSYHSDIREKLGSLNQLSGKWIHAQFSMGACSANDGGWFKLELQDQSGKTIHSSGRVKAEMMQGNKNQYLRPKMGLYRKRDDDSYTKTNTIWFQNLKYWKHPGQSC